MADFTERRCDVLAAGFDEARAEVAPVVVAYVSALRSECAAARVEVSELAALLSAVTAGGRRG